MTLPGPFNVEVQRATPRGELPARPIGLQRTALAHGHAVWRHWMGTSVANFCADAQRAVLWDEAGNRVVVEPYIATAPGAH
jgi:hypothetical protein